MHRLLCGLAFVSLLLTGCSSNPKLIQSGTYVSPAQAYTLDLSSASFRNGVKVAEQCDANGGTLNIWDSNNRFFRLDYLKVNKSPLAQIPSFANERTVSDIVLASYLRDVIGKTPSIQRSEVMFNDFVKTKRGEALFAMVSLDMNSDSLPKNVPPANYYYGFLIFQMGDLVYALQHRADAYQPDRIKNMLSNLSEDMTIPGAPRGEIDVSPIAYKTGYLASIQSLIGMSEKDINTTRHCD